MKCKEWAAFLADEKGAAKNQRVPGSLKQGCGKCSRQGGDRDELGKRTGRENKNFREQ